MTAQLLHLENRAVIRVSGPESRSFLQGLVTNDVDVVSAGSAVYAAMLTPQGKFLFDMIIVEDGSDLLLDVEAERKTDLLRRLMMYKLRADVDIVDEESNVWALIGGDSAEGIRYKDPRHKALHERVISKENPAPSANSLSYADYEERRIRHGVPDGSRDMKIEKYFWLETNAEKLNGVSFTKGCYVGQELTARMKHRTNLKKKILPVTLPSPDTDETTIKNASGKNVGDILTREGNYALAYVRLELLEDTPLTVGDIEVSINA